MKHSDFIKIAENMFNNDKVFIISIQDSVDNIRKAISKLNRAKIFNGFNGYKHKEDTMYFYDNHTNTFVSDSETLDKYLIRTNKDKKSIYAVLVENDYSINILYCIYE